MKKRRKKMRSKTNTWKKEMARALVRIQVPQLDLDVEFLQVFVSLLYIISFIQLGISRAIFGDEKTLVLRLLIFRGNICLRVIFCRFEFFCGFATSKWTLLMHPGLHFCAKLSLKIDDALYLFLFVDFQYLGAFMQNEGSTQLICND